MLNLNENQLKNARAQRMLQEKSLSLKEQWQRNEARRRDFFGTDYVPESFEEWQAHHATTTAI